MRWVPSLAVAAGCCAALAVWLTKAGLAEAPFQLADGRVVTPAVFVANEKLLLAEPPCTPAEVPERLAAAVAAYAARGLAAPPVDVTLDGAPALIVGYERDLPVVFLPCRGTSVLTPGRLAALRAGPPP